MILWKRRFNFSYEFFMTHPRQSSTCSVFMFRISDFEKNMFKKPSDRGRFSRRSHDIVSELLVKIWKEFLSKEKKTSEIKRTWTSRNEEKSQVRTCRNFCKKATSLHSILSEKGFIRSPRFYLGVPFLIDRTSSKKCALIEVVWEPKLLKKGLSFMTFLLDQRVQKLDLHIY